MSLVGALYLEENQKFSLFRGVGGCEIRIFVRSVWDLERLCSGEIEVVSFLREVSVGEVGDLVLSSGALEILFCSFSFRVMSQNRTRVKIRVVISR